MMKYDRLIVATGSRDLSIGFAGCDLSGTMGANGAHSLMSRYEVALCTAHGHPRWGQCLASTPLRWHSTTASTLPPSWTLRLPCKARKLLQRTLQSKGVELYTSHTVKQAVGTHGDIESVVLVEIDENCQPIAGTEKVITADTVCLAIGLVPSIEILSLLDCDLNFKSELGGYVPIPRRLVCGPASTAYSSLATPRASMKQ